MTYRTIHTAYGLQRMAQAEATGTPINITQIAVGDGNPVTARHAFVYNRALSDAEADEVAAFLPGYYADRGVTI
jgi:hypothetical protein